MNILPYKTPVWRFDGETDTGCNIIPIGDLVLFDKKLYIVDNDSNLDSTSSVRTAIDNGNFVILTTGGGEVVPPPPEPDPEPVKLGSPSISVSPSELFVDEDITLTISQIDTNSSSLEWAFSGEYELVNGDLTAKNNTLVLKVKRVGTFKAKVKAKAPDDSKLYLDSDYSNLILVTVKEVVTPPPDPEPPTENPEDRFDMFIDATSGIAGRFGVTVNPARTGGVIVFFNNLNPSIAQTPRTGYYTTDTRGASGDRNAIFKMNFVPDYVGQDILVKKVVDGVTKYYKGDFDEGTNSSRAPYILTEWSSNG